MLGHIRRFSHNLRLAWRSGGHKDAGSSLRVPGPPVVRPRGHPTIPPAAISGRGTCKPMPITTLPRANRCQPVSPLPRIIRTTRQATLTTIPGLLRPPPHRPETPRPPPLRKDLQDHRARRHDAHPPAPLLVRRVARRAPPLGAPPARARQVPHPRRRHHRGPRRAGQRRGPRVQ